MMVRILTGLRFYHWLFVAATCPVRIQPAPVHAAPLQLPLPGWLAGHARPARDRPGQDSAGHRSGSAACSCGACSRYAAWSASSATTFPRSVRHSRHRGPRRRHHRLGPRPDPGQPDGQPGPVWPLPAGPPLLAGPQAGLLPAGCHLGHRHPGLPAERARPSTPSWRPGASTSPSEVARLCPPAPSPAAPAA